jgi:hypothetical protein
MIDGTWMASAATSVNLNMFAVVDGTIYWFYAGRKEATPEHPASEPRRGRLDGSWDTVTMAGIGPQMLCWERSNRLYRVNTIENRWAELTGTYGDPVCATTLDKSYYVIESGILYSVSVDGAYAKYDNTWDVTQIVGLGDSLYMFERGGALYRKPVKGQAYSKLDGSWPETRAACALNGRLYAVNNGALYDIDPETGAYQMIDGSWTTTHLVPWNGKLMSFEANGALYRIEV